MKSNTPKKVQKKEGVKSERNNSSLDVFLSSKHQKANDFIKKVKLTY